MIKEWRTSLVQEPREHDQEKKEKEVKKERKRKMTSQQGEKGDGRTGNSRERMRVDRNGRVSGLTKAGRVRERERRSRGNRGWAGGANQPCPMGQNNN